MINCLFDFSSKLQVFCRVKVYAFAQGKVVLRHYFVDILIQIINGIEYYLLWYDWVLYCTQGTILSAYSTWNPMSWNSYESSMECMIIKESLLLKIYFFYELIANWHGSQFHNKSYAHQEYIIFSINNWMLTLIIPCASNLSKSNIKKMTENRKISSYSNSQFSNFLSRLYLLYYWDTIYEYLYI